MTFLNKKKGPALFELARDSDSAARGLTLAVVLTQVPFVVIDVALVFVAVFADISHITPVVINVALIVIAIHAVMVKVLLQALTIAVILPTIGELSLVPRDIAVICISIPAILVQILPVVIDVALVLIAVVPVLVQIAPVRLLIRRFRAGVLRGCARHKHAYQCNCSKTIALDLWSSSALPRSDPVAVG